MPWDLFSLPSSIRDSWMKNQEALLKPKSFSTARILGILGSWWGRLLGFFFSPLKHFSDYLPRYEMYFMGRSCGQEYIFQVWTLYESLYQTAWFYLCFCLWVLVVVGELKIPEMTFSKKRIQSCFSICILDKIRSFRCFFLKDIVKLLNYLLTGDKSMLNKRLNFQGTLKIGLNL